MWLPVVGAVLAVVVGTVLWFTRSQPFDLEYQQFLDRASAEQIRKAEINTLNGEVTGSLTQPSRHMRSGRRT